jgi:Uma2 family endonuclease
VTDFSSSGCIVGPYAELPPTAEEDYPVVMPSTTTRWTVDDRDRLPDDGNRYEVIDGELLVTPMPAPRHQELVKRLFRKLDAFVEAHDLGCAYDCGTDVIFSRHDVVVPDIAVYAFRPDRLPQRWADAPKPMLVVEVRSKSTCRRDVGVKRKLYVERTVPEYWIVDGDERTVTVVRPVGTDTNARVAVSWQPPGSRQTLAISLDEVFR